MSNPKIISTNHCLSKQNKDGQWTVTDKKSFNEVWVNGNQIFVEKAWPQSKGQSVRLEVHVEGTQVELEFVLAQDSLEAVKPFPHGVRLDVEATALPRATKTKRRLESDPADSPESRAKLYRCTAMNKSLGHPCLVEKRQQQEEDLKKQLEDSLQEQRKLIEELKCSRQCFEEILQAKDEELEMTREENEQAWAQMDEVVIQMTGLLENELQCIICSELLIEAVTLSCAHSFCHHCIGAWRKRSGACPICRQDILSQTRSLVLDNCVDRMVESLSTELIERRQVLIAERKEQSAVALVLIGDEDTNDSSYSSGSVLDVDDVDDVSELFSESRSIVLLDETSLSSWSEDGSYFYYDI